MAQYTLNRPTLVDGKWQNVKVTTDDREEFERLLKQATNQPQRALDLDKLVEVVEAPIERSRRAGRPVVAVQIPQDAFVRVLRVLDATGLKDVLPEFRFAAVRDLVENTHVDLGEPDLV